MQQRANLKHRLVPLLLSADPNYWSRDTVEEPLQLKKANSSRSRMDAAATAESDSARGKCRRFDLSGDKEDGSILAENREKW